MDLHIEAVTIVNPKKPILSIVLQVGGQRERSERCLASLLDQESIEQIEIILIDYGLGSFPPLRGSDHPSVMTIPRPEYEAFGFSRSLGVQKAGAPVVAFIEDHCIVDRGWAAAIVGAHSQDWKAIGGEVYVANSGVGISDAIAVMNYARWLAPARTGIYELLVGHNTAYDRQALLDFEDDLPLMLRCDPVLQWKLREEGHFAYLDDAIKFAHINETEIAPITRGYFLWNRMFAPTRARVFKWSPARRFAWIILSPLIPLVRITKQFAFILINRPSLLRDFLRSIPVQFIAQSVAAAGQTTGLIFGVGDAATSFLHYELNQVRREVHRQNGYFENTR